MTGPRFVITGTGRSGSGYIAQVLTAAGIPCGHEDWWNPQGEHADGLVGDSSWCALALGLDDFDGEVFVQLRHPLDVIGSLLLEPTGGAYADLRRSLVEGPSTDPLVYACQVHDAFVRAGEKAGDWTWRVDDVTADLVCEIGAHAGVLVLPVTARGALELVPTDFNRHVDRDRLTWSDLPEPWNIDLREWARSWGWS